MSHQGKPGDSTLYKHQDTWSNFCLLVLVRIELLPVRQSGMLNPMLLDLFSSSQMGKSESQTG